MQDKDSTIRINEKYVITKDPMNYTLHVITINKKGKEVFRIIGHYPNMVQALIACRDEMHKDELFKQDTWTLDDASALFVRVTNHLEAIIKGSFKGVAV